jgi:hypothetical protein
MAPTFAHDWVVLGVRDAIRPMVKTLQECGLV